MIARPIRRSGPIPFAPLPPLAERSLGSSPASRESRARARREQPNLTADATQAGSSRMPQAGCHAVYHGQGTLSVLSSISGHHYRFEGRGCTLSIDPRDRLVLGRLNELSIHPHKA